MSEWIEWKGGECPVPIGTVVDVIHRDGNQYNATNAGVTYSYAEDWSHDELAGDITAYRLSSVCTDEQTDDFQGSALIKQAVMA